MKAPPGEIEEQGSEALMKGSMWQLAVSLKLNVHGTQMQKVFLVRICV